MGGEPIHRMWPKASVENGKPFWVKLPIIAIVPLANMVSLAVQSPGDPINCKVDVIFLAEPENSYSKGLQVCFPEDFVRSSSDRKPWAMFTPTTAPHPNSLASGAPNG